MDNNERIARLYEAGFLSGIYWMANQTEFPPPGLALEAAQEMAEDFIEGLVTGLGGRVAAKLMIAKIDATGEDDEIPHP